MPAGVASRPLGAAVLAALIATSARTASAVVDLHIGAVLPLTGQIAIPGRGFDRAYHIALAHLNEDLPAGSDFQFSALPVCDDKTSVLTGADCALEFADFCGSKGYRPVAIFGAGFSAVSLQMAPITTRFKLLQCSPLSSTTDLSAANLYPFFMRTAPPDDKRAIAILRVAQVFGWSRVVLAYTTDRYGTTNGEQIKNAAVNYGIAPEDLSVITLPPNFYLFTADALASLEVQVLRKIRLSQTRVVIQVTLLDDALAFFRMAVQGGVIGPGWAWLGADAWANLGTPAVLQQIDAGGLGFSRKDLVGSILVIALEEETSTTKRFRDSYQARYNTTNLEPFIYAGYDCVRAIGLGVQALFAKYPSINASALPTMSLTSGIQEKLAAAAKDLSFDGTGGFVQFAKSGTANAGDRIPKYSVSMWEDGAAWVQRATFDENRAPDFLASGPIIFSNGLSTLDAAAPGCPAGRELNEAGDGCKPCPAGTYKTTSGRNVCSPCLAGFACPEGSVNMLQCQPGSYSAESWGSCKQCPVGNASSTPAATSCPPCSIGFVQPEEGQTNCQPCPFGWYQELQGQGTCERCLPTFSTELPATSRAAGCGCSSGRRLVRSGPEGPRCVTCGAGLNCSAFGQPPLLAPRHYMPADSPRDEEHINVFACTSTVACPGQENANSSVCAVNSVGLNCALCAEGFQHSSGPRACKRCSAGEYWAFPVAIAVAFPLLGLLHYFWNHGKAGQVEAAEGMLGSLTVGTTVAFIQNLGIVGTLLVPWAGKFRVLLDAFALLLFNFAVLSPTCVAPSTLVATYLVRIAAPVFFCAIFAIWLVLSRCLHRLSRGRFPAFHAAELVNTTGLLVMSLYISVATSTLAFVDCYRSPNNERTIRSMSFALCSGEEYVRVFPLFAAAVLLYLVGITALIAFTVVAAPRLYRYLWFRTSTRFLMFKFRPNRWWYNVMLLLRSFALSMVTVIFPDGAFEQWVCTVMIFFLALVIHLSVNPYSEAYANYLESIEVGALVCVMLLGSYYLAEPTGGAASGGIADTLIVLVVVCFVAVGLCSAWAIRLATSKTRGAKYFHARSVDKVLPKLMDACAAMTVAGPDGLKRVFMETTYADIHTAHELADLVLLKLKGKRPSRHFSKRISFSEDDMTFLITEMEKLDGVQVMDEPPFEGTEAPVENNEAWIEEEEAPIEEKVEEALIEEEGAPTEVKAGQPDDLWAISGGLRASL